MVHVNVTNYGHVFATKRLLSETLGDISPKVSPMSDTYLCLKSCISLRIKGKYHTTLVIKLLGSNKIIKIEGRTTHISS